jgi:hypothetical protein
MDPKKLYDAACELLEEGYENLSKVTNNQLAMKNVFNSSALSFNRAISKIELLVKYSNKRAKSYNMNRNNNNSSNNNNNNNSRTRKRSKSR